MKTKQFINFVFLAVLALNLTSCGKPNHAAPPALPSSWLNQNENQKEDSSDSKQTFEEPSALAAQNLDAILDAQGNAIENSTANTQAPSASPSPAASDVNASLPTLNHPKDWTPWHLDSFVTDLSVSVSGWLGSLFKKGTPSVTVIWRKQNPKASSAPAPLADSLTPAINLSSETTPADLKKEMEPVIKASLATGKIQDENAFRSNLASATRNFQAIAGLLNQQTSKTWWVSRFRLDLSVDASGSITPVFSVGGDVRIRLEWHRIMSKKPHPSKLQPQSVALFGIDDFGTKIIDFANSVADDITYLADNSEESLGAGFKAYGYRVGVGVSYNGKVGIAKVVSNMTGQIYFSRDVKKPVINPPVLRENDSLNLIAGGEGVVEINRKQFRKGLYRALNIGRFFARHAALVSSHSSWRIYELRTGFDLNFGGRTSLALVNGTGTSEINFYNENF